jgi:hypothetical protein
MRLGIRGSGDRWVVTMLGGLALLNGAGEAQAATLSISGTPATVVMPGDYYLFTPTVTGNSGTRRLKFTIENKPSWAYFNTSRGTLAGVTNKNTVGAYPNIVITVTNGVSTASLPPFTITVGNPSTPPSGGTRHRRSRARHRPQLWPVALIRSHRPHRMRTATS